MHFEPSIRLPSPIPTKSLCKLARSIQNVRELTSINGCRRLQRESYLAEGVQSLPETVGIIPT